MTWATCQYRNHEVPGAGFGTLHHYEDPAHGIPKGINICDACLLEHVRQYYPGSAIEQSILSLHPELVVTVTTETQAE